MAEKKKLSRECPREKKLFQVKALQTIYTKRFRSLRSSSCSLSIVNFDKMNFCHNETPGVGQVDFTGGQNILNLNFFIRKKIALDGYFQSIYDVGSIFF